MGCGASKKYVKIFWRHYNHSLKNVVWVYGCYKILNRFLWAACTKDKKNKKLNGKPFLC